MNQSQSIQNRLIFGVFGSVFIFTASLLIFYENKLHQLSVNKSSQIIDLIERRYHEKISNFLTNCHQHFENVQFKLINGKSESIHSQLNTLLKETKCYQETGIYLKKSDQWITSQGAIIYQDQVKNLIKTPQSSYWLNENKSYLMTRDIYLGEDAKLMFLMNLRFVRTQLNKYLKVLQEYGFKNSAVFIKNSQTFQGFGIKESYYNKIRAKDSEIKFQLEGIDFISMKSIPMPVELGAGFLCLIIPSYDVFESIYNTGFLPILSVLILLIISILFVVYIGRITIRPLRKAIIQIEKSTINIGQVSDQNLAVGQELSDIVHKQSDIIRQLLNQAENLISLGGLNSLKLTASKDFLVNTIQSIQSSLSSVGNISIHLNMLQNLSDEIKIELNSLCEISNRMDVISTNASIEAARLGIRGRNFSVIADQIAKLLTDSLERSSKMEHNLKSLNKHIEETVSLSNRSQNLLNLSVSRAEETSEALELIALQSNQQINQLNMLIKVLTSSDRKTIKNQQLAKHCAELGVLLNRSIDDLLQVSQLIASIAKK